MFSERASDSWSFRLRRRWRSVSFCTMAAQYPHAYVGYGGIPSIPGLPIGGGYGGGGMRHLLQSIEADNRVQATAAARVEVTRQSLLQRP